LERVTTITISKEYLKFSAAHFTIFSATDRERLHGHNFAVAVDLTAPVGDNGMCFSYRILKDRVQRLCDDLDEYMLLSGLSPFLEISEEGNQYKVRFNNEDMYFLKCDTLVLPIRNATVEEYSHYILTELLNDDELVGAYDIRAIEVRVSSGPGQWGSAQWSKRAG